MKPFDNPKFVSCYANSVIQFLFNNQFVQKMVEQFTLPSIFRNLYNRYHNKNDNNFLNLDELREEIFGKNELGKQQDASEFFEALVKNQNLIKLQDLCKFTQETTRTCSCSVDQIIKTEMFTLQIPIPLKNSRWFQRNQPYSASFPTLLHTILNGDSQPIKDFNCSICGKPKFTQDRYKNFKDIIPFVLQKAKPGGKITDFQLDDVADKEIIINNQPYVLDVAIFHVGGQLKSGHYYAVRKHGDSFIEANDKSVKQLESWPIDTKNLYMMFYNRKTN